MKHLKMKKLKTGLISFSLITVVSGCGLNPQNADTDLNNTLPEAKSTVYQEAVRKLGMMSVIYGRLPLNIMSKNIADQTGTSVATRAEIPQDITEIVKSTLNGIGGNITFIPYDPDFLASSVNTGYSEFGSKLIPDVVVSGGITEFDRGLVTKGDSAEIDATFGDFGLGFEDNNKGSLAQVTLDFNLIDFKTLAGIPRIQAVNGIKLHKAIKEDSFAFTVKSVTLGAKGTIKKVQGRHSAVRLLVELSMAQLIGRFQKLPYWRMLPGGQTDDIVIDAVLNDFYDQTEKQRVVAIQSYLFLHGYDVKITGLNDSITQTAIQQFSEKNSLNGSGVDQATYLALFESIPVDHATRSRSKTLAAMLSDYKRKNQLYSAYKPNESAKDLVDDGTLTLWSDKSEYVIGEQMNINFSVDKPMFVRMVVINSEGEISTLFPNAYQSDNYCKPGIDYQIPPKQAEFVLDIGGPSGTDKIRAVASKNPIAAEALYFTSTGDFDLNKMAALPVRASAEITIR